MGSLNDSPVYSDTKFIHIISTSLTCMLAPWSWGFASALKWCQLGCGGGSKLGLASFFVEVTASTIPLVTRKQKRKSPCRRGEVQSRHPRRRERRERRREMERPAGERGLDVQQDEARWRFALKAIKWFDAIILFVRRDGEKKICCIHNDAGSSL